MDLAVGSYVRAETRLICPERRADNTLAPEQMMLRASLVKASHGGIADITRLVHGGDTVLVFFVGVAARPFGLADAGYPCLGQWQLMGLTNSFENMRDLWYNCSVRSIDHLTTTKQAERMLAIPAFRHSTAKEP